MQLPDLRTAVNRHSWAWLLELPHRLNVVLEIVDEHFTPLLPISDHSAAEIRQLVYAADPALRSVMAAASQFRRPQTLAIAGHICVCFALAPTGVLILARRSEAEGESALQTGRELEAIGTWLVGAVEANLASVPGDAGAEQHRIASLRRLLRDASARGSIRQIVSAFAEAVAVWSDVEVRGYVSGARGGFFQDVTLLGADPAATPDQLDESMVPTDATVHRLSDMDIERLGLISVAEDVVVARVAADQAVLWLLIFAGTIDANGEVALRLYVDLLRESLNAVATASAARMSSAITQYLLRQDNPPQVTAQLALDEVIGTLGANQGALVVTTAAGSQTLTVGAPELWAASAHDTRPDRIVVSSQAEHEGDVMTMVITGEAGRLTSHERALVGTAARLFSSWVRGTLGRAARGERRGTALPVSQQIEQLAEETIQAGRQASLIMISVHDALGRPDLVHAWVARIRNRLRPWDFAGIVDDGEIAVLLRDMSGEQAGVVAARLRKMFDADANGSVSIRPSIGTATASAGMLAGSLVRAAREDASRPQGNIP